MKGRGLKGALPKGEGGADASYDGAHTSSFEKAISKQKGTGNFEKRTERFKSTEQALPEVDVQQRGMADAAVGKQSANWAASKPRFQDPQPSLGAGDYEPPPSVFENIKTTPSPHMRTPEKPLSRSDHTLNRDQVESPAPTDLPGAFDQALAKANKPSTFTASSKPRFSDPPPSSAGADPAAYNAAPSTFEAAISSTKGSANFSKSADRFKTMYAVPSYGDPGEGRSQAEIDADNRERKIAHQRQQVENKAQTDLAKEY